MKGLITGSVSHYQNFDMDAPLNLLDLQRGFFKMLCSP